MSLVSRQFKDAPELNIKISAVQAGANLLNHEAHEDHKTS